MKKNNGQITGMAGEFFVMEKLFRLGVQACLTLGNAKAIDILAVSEENEFLKVEVKSNRGGGKWGVGTHDYSSEDRMVFVFLYYEDFDILENQPEVWVMKARDVEKLKRPWFNSYAIYLYKEDRENMDQYRNNWAPILDVINDGKAQ